MPRSDFLHQDTTDKSYDINEIHTPSQDRKGHSVNLRVHVPVPWGAVLQHVVSSDSWPEYRNLHDIVRDALYHRMHWIQEQKAREQFPMIYEALIRAHFDRRLTVMGEEAADWRKHSEKIDQVMAVQITTGNVEAIKSYIEDFLPKLVYISEPYRTRLTALLQSWAARAGISWAALENQDPNYDPGIHDPDYTKEDVGIHDPDINDFDETH